nr:hypothetical protein [Tanacetum cinerariifolium]
GDGVRWIYGGVVFGHGNGGVVTVVKAVMVWLWWWREGVAETQIVTRCGGDEDGVKMVTVVEIAVAVAGVGRSDGAGLLI